MAIAPHPLFDFLRLTFMLSGFALLGWNYGARYRETAVIHRTPQEEGILNLACYVSDDTRLA